MLCGSVVSYGNYFQYPSPLILMLAHVFLGLSATGLVWYEKLRNVKVRLAELCSLILQLRSLILW